MALRKIRVLIVDDSALVRSILTQGLSQDPAIEVVGTASDPYVARDRIIELNPDVLTLDVEMPRMDGVAFLRRLMPQHPLPVVMVSSLTQRGQQVTMDALDAGAVDFVAKPTSDVARGLGGMLMELRTKIKIASGANVSRWKNRRPASTAPFDRTPTLRTTTDKIVAIGASTGGTEAVRQIVSQFPASMPGTLVVQHMPAVFTAMFAERLNKCSPMEVREAADGDRLREGLVLVAPGDLHMELVRTGGHYQVRLNNGDKVNSFRPSVDVMMHSVAKQAGANALGVILTGMGRDGAQGLLAMRNAGAYTIAQDAESSVVYGMPRVAAEVGGACAIHTLFDIAPAVVKHFSEDSR